MFKLTYTVTAESAVEAVASTFRRNAAEGDATARLPQGDLDELRSSGLLAFLVPFELGGLGGNVQDFVEVACELGGASISSAMVWVMHCQQIATILRFGSPSLIGRVVPAVVQNGCLLASVTTEHERTAGLFKADSTFAQAGDRLRIKRAAPIVTAARHAGGFLVTGCLATAASRADVSLVYVDKALADVRIISQWDPIGMRGTESPSIELEADVDADCVIGGPGGFREIALEAFAPLSHLGWSAAWLGTARTAFAELIVEARSGALRSRVADDSWKEDVGRIRSELEMTNAYLRHVSREIREAWSSGDSLQGTVHQIHLNTLKVIASENLFSACNQMLELAGLFHGYARRDGILGRAFRDLRSASLNFSNKKLVRSNGVLSLLDSNVSLNIPQMEKQDLI